MAPASVGTTAMPLTRQSPSRFYDRARRSNSRHCERSEAIQLRCGCGHGLLRCARNDDAWTACFAAPTNCECRGCLKTKSTAVVPHKRSAMRDPKPPEVVRAEVIEPVSQKRARHERHSVWVPGSVFGPGR